MNIIGLQREYAAETTSPDKVVADIYARLEQQGQAPAWISLVPREKALAKAVALKSTDRETLPLYGIPFAVKDNIDVEGMPTTVGCPDFAYTPAETATVVQHLEAAGAILIGKTNMDQFATGLVGTRSPYGACSSVFSAEMISGGSSSGSAVVVAGGLVCFSLGTDTAGSGRVPAMFNNIVGLKPTRGLISAHGVVPACRSLDCVSIFAGTVAEASLVLSVAQRYDARDPYSREAQKANTFSTSTFRFGVPKARTLNFFDDPYNGALFDESVEALTQVGGTPVEVDLTPFLATAQLLYRGPWVAERTAAIEPFLANHRSSMDPIVASIIAGGERYSAIDTFRGQYELRALEQKTRDTWKQIDLLLLPTSPRTYTHAEIAAAPIERNSQLGLYTNFVNLLDLAAVAVPAGLRPDGLPFGVSLIGPAHTDQILMTLGDRLHRKLAMHVGGTELLLNDTEPYFHKEALTTTLLMAVVGAHLSGQPLNWQLTDRGATLVRTCRSSMEYKLYALSNTKPLKPGLVRVPGYQGPGIEVEVWSMPADTIGTFVDGVPQPLGIGKLRLEDDTLVMGFIAEPAATADAKEITAFGSWRNYLASLEESIPN